VSRSETKKNHIVQLNLTFFQCKHMLLIFGSLNLHISIFMTHISASGLLFFAPLNSNDLFFQEPLTISGRQICSDKKWAFMLLKQIFFASHYCQSVRWNMPSSELSSIKLFARKSINSQNIYIKHGCWKKRIFIMTFPVVETVIKKDEWI